MFSFRNAIKFPIVVSNTTKFKSLKGKIEISSVKTFGLIRIGFHEVPALDCSNLNTVLELCKDSTLKFDGSAHIGCGSILYVSKNAILTLGDNFAISAKTSIVCHKNIFIDRDVQFSWDCLVMDSDSHSIFNDQGIKINEDDNIYIGKKVWVGCRSTILKGSSVHDNSVIGSNSLVNTKYSQNNIIIAGIPAKVIKKISHWEI